MNSPNTGKLKTFADNLFVIWSLLIVPTILKNTYSRVIYSPNLDKEGILSIFVGYDFWGEKYFGALFWPIGSYKNRLGILPQNLLDALVNFQNN